MTPTQNNPGKSLQFFPFASIWIRPQKNVSHKKYVNIPSEKYFYVHIYVCICVYTYLCKMDERRSYASLS